MDWELWIVIIYLLGSLVAAILADTNRYGVMIQDGAKEYPWLNEKILMNIMVVLMCLSSWYVVIMIIRDEIDDRKTKK